MYENLKILILGGAKSGIAVARLLASNNDITLSDLKDIDEDIKSELSSLGINIVIGDNQLDLLDEKWDLIIKNPAIMYTSDIVKKCNELGLRVENEMEVAYHFLPKYVTLIGVTGSNGKTTTTTIIYELLKKMGKSVVLGGNIGNPLANIVGSVKEEDIVLLEISDHQLCDVKDFKTNVSVLTNICPTHLDYHGTYEHYMWTKKNIFNHHDSDCKAIINKNDEDSLKVTEDILFNKVYFNNNDNYYNDEGIFVDKELIVKLDDIVLKGTHNYENILCALLVIKEYGLDKEIIKEFLGAFGGVEHRLEFVCELDGVKYYNDSKATNPTATITALKTFKEPVHLILGGMERYQDFNELNGYMESVKCIYAIGTTTKRVKEYADSRNIECIECDWLDVAVKKIKENVKKGDIVLLSTASASQDRYVKFEDRGEEFKNLVKSAQ